MIYFGPGATLGEIALVLGAALIIFGFVLRGIIRSEERKHKR